MDWGVIVYSFLGRVGGGDEGRVEGGYGDDGVEVFGTEIAWLVVDVLGEGGFREVCAAVHKAW